MEKIPKCNPSSQVKEDEMYDCLLEGMEKSCNGRLAKGLPRAVFPQNELDQHLVFRCAKAAFWHWADHDSNNRKRELKKHAKAAINQSARLSVHWKDILTSSSALWNILDAFQSLFPDIVWARLRRVDYDFPLTNQEDGGSDVKHEMKSTVCYQAHRKETAVVFRKIADLSYVQMPNNKVHWKLKKALEIFNDVSNMLFCMIYDELYSYGILPGTHGAIG
jgi:hypothetical protein